MSTDPIEQLERLGRDYRHVSEERAREGPRSSTRRRLQSDMGELIERFERLLEQWVQDPELRDAWQAYFYSGAPRPSEPRLEPAPLFRGRTEADAIVEIYEASDGGYDLFVDRKRARHHEVPWELDPELIEPFQIGSHTCTEIFEASDAAIAALERFLEEPGTAPPWRWARELYEDGLTDADFALTPRGARRLDKARETGRAGEGRANYVVILANAGRARVLALASATPEERETLARLEEVADMRDPERRARDSELFSDTRPGLRREGSHGPRHAVSDRREGHRHENERRFVEQIVDEAERIWSRFRSCTIVVVATPHVLGLLRPAIARCTRGPSPHDVVELSRDLTALAAPVVHDALARASILPPPGRLPPIKPMRTPNPWQE